MAREGQIKVQSEKIFPIIKKWLYSDKDIFLRELVSNASDAIKKLERLNAIGEADTGEEKGRIEIQIDPEAKTLSVSDNGIGMTEDEVEKYITQIAFSGAEDFIEKYKDKTDAEAGIIGHFGLGFYSALWFPIRWKSIPCPTSPAPSQCTGSLTAATPTKSAREPANATAPPLPCTLARIPRNFWRNSAAGDAS